MTNLLSLSSAQLMRAVKLKNQIAKLEARLSAILGSPATSTPSRKKFRMSAAARAKIAAAQKARWAKAKGKKAVNKPAKRKYKMSAAGRARIAAAAKARWAKAKAAGKSKL